MGGERLVMLGTLGACPIEIMPLEIMELEPISTEQVQCKHFVLGEVRGRCMGGGSGGRHIGEGGEGWWIEGRKF